MVLQKIVTIYRNILLEWPLRLWAGWQVENDRRRQVFLGVRVLLGGDKDISTPVYMASKQVWANKDVEIMKELPERCHRVLVFLKTSDVIAENSNIYVGSRCSESQGDDWMVDGRGRIPKRLVYFWCELPSEITQVRWEDDEQ